MENFDLEKFKEYVNTYEEQISHKSYSVETILNDFLYGIGICLDKKYENNDGFNSFKAMLLKHLEAVPAPKKCYCGNPVDESNADCQAYNLCEEHAMDC